jgi:hypothetical protein
MRPSRSFFYAAPHFLRSHPQLVFIESKLLASRTPILAGNPHNPLVPAPLDEIG